MNDIREDRSVDYFDIQYGRQIHSRDYRLNPFEIRAMNYLKGTILDLGCGLGNLSLQAGQSNFHVVAVDASQIAIDRILLRSIKPR